MNFLASGFQNFINAIFENWAMILFVLLAVLLVLAILFRKFKVVGFILFFIAVAIGVALIIYLITQAVNWDLVQLINFIVKWVPTILFAIVIVVTTFWGAVRGLRKSLIMLAHSVGAAAVCITLYFVLINIPQVDKFVLDVVNFFMGGAGSLENALGLHAQCYGIKDVFVAWLPTVLTGDFAIMLGGSTAYIYTLADMLYHFAFFLILCVVYVLLKLIMYVIYHCCYSERKYKRKITEKYAQNKVDRRYSRHSLGGSVVGICRGTVAGVLGLSILGTLLFSVAGLGQGKLQEADFEKDDINTYYSVYRAVENYGNYGVFKVLNSIASPDETPYYLFAADLVFSGRLTDEEFGIDENIVFREELSAYTGFARETAALLLKYGADDLIPVINGSASDKTAERVVQVMSDEHFRAEFNDLIAEFDAQTYVINFALSFVNTAIANIDEMSFGSSVSAANKDLFKMLFTKGYLSDANPDEKLLKDSLPGEATMVLPYINLSKFVTKQDVQVIFNVAMDVLSGNMSTVDNTVALISKILPKIEKLSLLSKDRAEELNPVMCRLYCYAANTYLTETDSPGVTYTSVYNEKIDWTGEIRSLIEVSDATFALYGYAYTAGANPVQIVNNLFDKDGEHYAEICDYYDAVCDNIARSHILGQVMSTSKMYSTVKTALSGVFKDIYIPDNVQYDSKFDGEGNLISAGEVYNVLNGVRLIGRNTEVLSIMQNFDKDADMGKLLDEMSAVVSVKDDYGNTVTDYIVNSDLLRSVATAALKAYGADYVYVPQAALESDGEGNKVNFIKQSELTALLVNLDEVIKVAKPLLENKDADIKQVISDFMQSEVFDTLLDTSTIFEGSVAKLLIKSVADSELVVVPKALSGEELDGWVSVAGRQGELKNLLSAIKATGLELPKLLSNEINQDEIIDNVLALSDGDLKTVLKSSLMHYTLSKFLTGDGLDFGSFKLIVPSAAQKQLSDDVIEGLVKEEELSDILQVVRDFDLNDETDVSSVFVQLVKNKDTLKTSYILAASVSYSVANSAEIADMLKLPQTYADYATLDKLKVMDSTNPWKQEISGLVDALDEVLGISSAEEFTFDEEKLTQSLSTLLNTLNDDSAVAPGVTTRLGVCYKSEIIKNNITVRLDELLDGRVGQNLLNSAKELGYYKKTELTSLCSALNVFGIDLTDFDAEKLTENVKEKIFTLNDPAEEGGTRTKLDVVYPSVIFSGLFSEELDRALLENTDENGELSPMIDAETLAVIKGGSRYSKDELKNIINSIKAFGINSFDDIDSLDFDSIKDKTDKIDEICLSLVIRGVMTYQIAESDGIDVNHPLAYEKDVKILRTSEISSLVTLINSLPENTDLAEMYFEEIKLSTVKDNTFDSDGNVKSYLLLKSVSTSVKNCSQLLVNESLIDSYGCINHNELYKLIGAIITVQGDDNVNLLEFTELRYPDLTGEQRAEVFSSELLRAKLTEQLIKENRPKEGQPQVSNFISGNNLTKFTDWRTSSPAYLISETELNALFEVLDLFGGEFKIPAVNYNNVKAMYDANPDSIDMLFASDVIRYKVCDSMLQRFASLSEKAVEETAYDISAKPIAAQTKLVLTLSDVKEALQAVSA